MNFITIIGVSIGVIVITFITIKFIKIFLNHKEYTVDIDKLSNFNKKVIKWSEEIQDELIKHEYLHFCTNRMFNIDKITGEIKRFRLDEYHILEQEIIEKFVNHIPSLKQELREEKLNKILT